MHPKSWKRSETRMARDVGSERIPADGTREGADFTDSIACYQLKVRRSIPRWLWSWLDGIRRFAMAHSGRVGVLVLKHPGMRDTEAVVILSWRDWVDLHGTSMKGKRNGSKEALVSTEDRWEEEARERHRSTA